MKFDLVKILWMDAEADNSWMSEAEIDAEKVGDPVTTVGFLVRKPTKVNPFYTVAGTIAYGESKEAHFNNIMKIPKAWVTSVDVLENKE